MPQVPYNPVPQENLSGGSLSEQHPQASESTFGGDIAKAISGLGKTVEGVGDQIYERATFLQDLQNKAEARKADADYIVKSGQISAQFNSLEGDQAVKAYPKYQQDLKALRSSIRGSLSTSSSQEMYDGQTLGTLSRAIFSGASHTAAAQKKYVTDSMEAQRTAIREEAATYPQDDMSTQRAIRRTEQSVREEGKLRGQPPEAIDNAVKTYTSAIYTDQIKTTSKDYPLQGPAALDKFRTKLTRTDFEKVETFVNAQRDSYGVSKISTDLISVNMNDDGTLKKPMAEILADARKLAAQFSPDDPQFEQKLVRGVEGQFRTENYAKKVETQQNQQAFWSVVGKGGINNKFDFVQDPDGLAIYQAMTPKQQAQVEGQINRYVDARDKKSNQEKMTMLTGLRERDVDAFLDIDPSDKRLNLSQPNIQTVMGWQRKARAEEGKSPRVEHAMTLLKQGFGPQMHDLGVYSLSKANQEDYDHFIGATQQALESWREEYKKPPTDREFNEQIAPVLLKSKRQTWGDFFFGAPRVGGDANEISAFKHDTDSKAYRSFSQQVKDKLQQQGQEAPTDHEIYKLYSRKVFNDLYKASQKEKP